MKYLFSPLAALFIFATNSNCTNNNRQQQTQNTSTMATATPADTTGHTETAIFAGGCFWGTQYFFEKAKGVITTQVGYTGGHVAHPTYQEVCTHTTGHYEAVKVTFDTRITNYEAMAKLFFDIHDPTQANGQGPDIGQQYMSVVFYQNNTQKQIAEKLIKILETKGYKVVTQLKQATTFWPAEQYHEHHYDKEGTVPYCHRYQNKFN